MFHARVLPIVIPGTMTADIPVTFTVPETMQLVHVSAVCSNAAATRLKIGTAADDDAYMSLKSVGQSGTPAEFDRDDFIGAAFPQIPKGTAVKVTIDYDGGMGTAGADLALVLTFTGG